MVRLETSDETLGYPVYIGFTFQYGQIRNGEGQKLENGRGTNLHSSMVRLETPREDEFLSNEDIFTFQYGQIRNA